MKTLTFAKVRRALTVAAVLSVGAGMTALSAAPASAAPRGRTYTTVRRVPGRPGYSTVRRTTVRRSYSRRPSVVYRTPRRQVITRRVPVRPYTYRRSVVRHSYGHR